MRVKSLLGAPERRTVRLEVKRGVATRLSTVEVKMEKQIKVARPDFYQIPSSILDDEDLNIQDGLVYAVVYWYCKMKLEKCIASNETLAKQAKSTKSSVANSLSRLAKKGYIRIVLDDKHHRIEIIPLVVWSTPSPVSEAPFTSELTPPSPVGEHNKNINNKNIYLETEKAYRSLSFLLRIPEDVSIEFSKQFKASENQVKEKAEDLYHYCVGNGKRYSNYKSFLRNALKRDFGLRPNQPSIEDEPVEEIPMTPEQQAMAQAKLAELRAKAKNIGSISPH